MGEQNRRFRKDIPQISTDRKESRKETLKELLKLTREITSNFNKEKGGICRKPLNGFPDPPKRPFTKAPTVTLDGRPGVPKQMAQTQSRRAQQQSLMSRGPALNPTNACYELTDLCKKLEIESGFAFKDEKNCKCSGCAGPCSALGPHSHRDSSNCLRDYCNYPCFKPPTADMTGNQWSGEVISFCNYPHPCKADCFDHIPPGDYIDTLDL